MMENDVTFYCAAQGAIALKQMGRGSVKLIRDLCGMHGTNVNVTTTVHAVAGDSCSACTVANTARQVVKRVVYEPHAPNRQVTAAVVDLAFRASF
jgi:hypothetical protein